MGLVITNNETIKQAFDSIPTERILEVANKVQRELRNSQAFATEKSPGQFVTQADLLIQEIILTTFASSSLAGSYFIKSEEQEREDGGQTWNERYLYQLLIDPLDGTNAFCKGSKDWGVMVGLCDLSGCLLYSWNLLSDGTVFSNDTRGAEVLSWKAQKASLNIDFYNYGAGDVTTFISSLSKRISSNVNALTFDSAVAAAHALYSGRCQGLLWLPSEQGKKFYPDYDLIFLGALKSQGWHCLLGKDADAVNFDRVNFLAVAPSASDLQILKEVGMLMLDEKLKERLEFSDSLCITGSI